MPKVRLIITITLSLLLIFCGKEGEEDSRKKDKAGLITFIASGIFIAIPTYYALTEKAYSKEAQIQMKNMVKSASNYYLKEGEMPPDCYETMVVTGDIEIAQVVMDSWDFECTWEYDGLQMSGTVTATSTDANDAGPGKIIEYDILNNDFTGYGQGANE